MQARKVLADFAKENIREQQSRYTCCSMHQVNLRHSQACLCMQATLGM